RPQPARLPGTLQGRGNRCRLAAPGPDVGEGVRVAVDLRSRARVEDALREPRPGRGRDRSERLRPDLEPARVGAGRYRLRAGNGAEALAAFRRHPPPACTPPMRSGSTPVGTLSEAKRNEACPPACRPKAGI